MANYFDTFAGTDLVPLTASATPFRACRGLLVGTGGTADIIMRDGRVCEDVPLQAGYNPLQIKALTALGTAADVWAIY